MDLANRLAVVRNSAEIELLGIVSAEIGSELVWVSAEIGWLLYGKTWRLARRLPG